jgi:hypothetical protein
VPVLAANLADGAGDQWAVFGAAAVRAGAAATFAFPLRIGAIRVGVLAFTGTRTNRWTPSSSATP